MGGAATGLSHRLVRNRYPLLTNTARGVQPVDGSSERFTLVPDNTANLFLHNERPLAVGELS